MIRALLAALFSPRHNRVPRRARAGVRDTLRQDELHRAAGGAEDAGRAGKNELRAYTMTTGRVRLPGGVTLLLALKTLRLHSKHSAHHL